MEKSPLDNALIKIGFGHSLMQHDRFFRSDEPPENVIFQTNQIVEPKYDHSQNDNCMFPFRIENKVDNKMAFAKNEFLKFQEMNIKQLLDYYKKLYDHFDSIKEGNKVAVNKADMLVKRKHFYYCYLTSLISSPLNIGLKNLNQLIALRKLFMNYKFKSSKKNSFTEQCCIEPNCPQIAICGSSYCGWHILKDPDQHLYKKCPVCGWPCMINNFIPCQIHRGKQKPQRKSLPSES